MFNVNIDVSADCSTHIDIIIYFYLQSIEYECAENGDRNEAAEKKDNFVVFIVIGPLGTFFCLRTLSAIM